MLTEKIDRYHTSDTSVGAIDVFSEVEGPRFYDTLFPFLIQNLLILLALSLFAASIHMLLGRNIRLTDGDSRSLIRGRF